MRWVALCVVLSSMCVGTWAQPLRRVRVDTPQAAAAARQLIAAGFDVLETTITDGSFEIIGSVEEMEELRDRGFTPITLEIGRPFRKIQEERRNQGDGVPEGYSDLAEIIERMTAFAAAFPDICQFVDLTDRYQMPATFEGRHLFALKISDNAAIDEHEPAFLIVSDHHAREIVTPEIALHVVEQFTARYGSDPAITALVDQYEIWIAPTWNPDGYNEVFEGDNLWRKNRRVFAQGIGVDQNRNYPFGWNSSCSGSTRVTSATYKGPSPASEPETQTMMAFSEDRGFAKVIDYHSHGRVAVYAYDCSTHPLASYLRNEAILLSNASTYGGATRSPSAEGDHYEWQLAAIGGLATLIEAAAEFQPPFNSALVEAERVFSGVLFAFERPIPLNGRVTDARTGDPLAAAVDVLEVNYAHGETFASNGRTGLYHQFLPPGAYTVEFSVDGYVSQQHVVQIVSGVALELNVPLERPFAVGDVNCDGSIDALDIEPFLVALFDPGSYAGRYPDCDINLADINGDGSINALDIEPFLDLLFP